MHKIFQGYYDEHSKQYLDPVASAVDIGFNLNHPLYEYNIFKMLLASGTMNPDLGPCGFVSWKFKTKTLVELSKFSECCEKAFAKGADVVFINPMIGNEALYKNVWEQGEHCGHSGMLTIFRALFSAEQAAQVDMMSRSVFAFCNYFVGNKKFWSKYIAFCDAVLTKIESFKETQPQIYALIYQSASYHRNTAVDYRPFILERLFSTFLLLEADVLTAHFSYPQAVYEKKFGSNVGQYLYSLSEFKNGGIYGGKIDLLRKWDELRNTLLVRGAVEEIWQKDDPAA